jgi:hypothetical protein
MEGMTMKEFKHVSELGVVAGMISLLAMIVLGYTEIASDGLIIALAVVTCIEFVLAFVYALIDYLEAYIKVEVAKELSR